MKIVFMDFVLLFLSILCLTMGVVDIVYSTYYRGIYMFVCSAVNLAVAVVCITWRNEKQ